jgi:ATP adenylyltransferase
MEYIQNTNKDEGCAFCQALAQPDDPENLIIVRSRRAFVILNRFPYTSGHLMVVPYEHLASLEELDGATRAEIMELATRAIRVLKAEYQPQGFNLGMNLGEIAGAGIASHVHMHVVPRWGGDSNFMTALANTRVLPEALDDSYGRIRAAWQANEAV